MGSLFFLAFFEVIKMMICNCPGGVCPFGCDDPDTGEYLVDVCFECPYLDFSDSEPPEEDGGGDGIMI